MPHAFAVVREQHGIAGSQFHRLATVRGEGAAAADDMAELAVLEEAAEHARAAFPHADAGADRFIGLVLGRGGMGDRFADRQAGRGWLAEAAACCRSSLLVSGASHQETSAPNSEIRAAANMVLATP